MRVLLFSFLLLFFSESFCQSYPHLFDLQGLEDNQGNTHLFYRYGYPGTPSLLNCWSKSIYHIDLSSGTDTLFFYDAASDPIGEGCRGQSIGDLEFLDNDQTKYIYGGCDYYIDPIALMVRYDGQIQIESFGEISEIEMSKQNDSLFYAAITNALFKSTDGGYNFTIDYDSLAWIDNAMISLSNNNDSQIYGIDDKKLVRSENEGYSYIIVDDNQVGGWNDSRELFYDADGQHIYYVVNSYSESTLRLSDNNGNPNSWSEIVTTPAKMSFTMDEENTGEIYYSYRKGIYKSTGYGGSFLLYKELDQKVTGLYKKSGSDILYALTGLKIYEITPDSIITIKSLTIPQFVFDWFPMNIGNHWVYEIHISEAGGREYIGDETSSIIGIETLNNGLSYFLYKRVFLNGSSDTTFIRIDSSLAKLYAYSFELGSDLLFENLMAEAGDTVCYEYNPAWNCQHVQPDIPFQIFGLNTLKKEYLPQAPGSYVGHTLVNGFGIYEVYIGDLTTFRSTLKGCVIDGAVYGDTITVSVDDENQAQPTEFSLEQNYPNPFNPVTTISFTISEFRFTTLKIYDVLGNEVAILVNEEKPAGSYEVQFSINNLHLTSGIYFYQLRASDFVEAKKMVLMK